MSRLVGPLESLKGLSAVCEGTAICPEIYEQTGVFIIRSLFSKEFISSYRNYVTSELRIGGALRNKFNPVSVETSDVRARSISRDPNLVKELNKILGPDICLYSFRFVLKDKDNYGAVFLHNDIGYHLGYMNRISAFVAVSDAGPVNGGMEFFLGTHKFGLMGDAGELNVEVLGDEWPVIRPTLLAGDVVIMNSSLWHQSVQNIEKTGRIIADIHYQPSNDPSGIELISGEWKTDYRIPREVVPRLFKRSRVSRLIELESDLSQFKKTLPSRKEF